MTTLKTEDRKARKTHVCDYCSQEIQKGEVYRYSSHVFEGEAYSWRAHEKCAELAETIWDLVDPDDGMTGDDFRDKLREVAATFVCPECPYLDRKLGDCDCELKPKCIDHIYEFFQAHELVMTDPYVWKCVKKEEK